MSEMTRVADRIDDPKFPPGILRYGGMQALRALVMKRMK